MARGRKECAAEGSEWSQALADANAAPRSGSRAPTTRRDEPMATRIDVARAVADKERISIQDANSIIGTILEVIRALLQKEEVQLVGLGRFRRVTRAARTGRNPKTGEAISIPEKIMVRFKPSKGLNPSAAAPKAAGAKRRGRPAAKKRKVSG